MDSFCGFGKYSFISLNLSSEDTICSMSLGMVKCSCIGSVQAVNWSIFTSPAAEVFQVELIVDWSPGSTSWTAAVLSALTSDWSVKDELFLEMIIDLVQEEKTSDPLRTETKRRHWELNLIRATATVVEGNISNLQAAGLSEWWCATLVFAAP